MQDLKKNWLTLLVSLLMAAFLSTAISWTSAKNEKVEGAASVEYVNQENDEQNTYIDSENDVQDANCVKVKENLQGQINGKADSKIVDMIYESQMRSEDRVLKLIEGFEERLNHIHQ